MMPGPFPEVGEQYHEVGVRHPRAEHVANIDARRQRTNEPDQLVVHSVEALEFGVAERCQRVLLDRSPRSGSPRFGAGARGRPFGRWSRHFDHAEALALASDSHSTDALVDVLPQANCRHEEPFGGPDEDGPPIPDSKAIQPGLALQRLDVQAYFPGGESELPERRRELCEGSGNLRWWGVTKRPRQRALRQENGHMVTGLAVATTGTA